MKKKVVSLLLTVAMAATMLAGCGGGDKPSGGNTDNNSGDKKEENITITMMYSGTASENDFETTILPGLVKEKFPNITLEATKLPDDNYYTALKTKLASGECPDIILVQPMHAGANAVLDLAAAGYLADLSDMKAVELAGGGANAFTLDGKVYGIPNGVDILATYYNVDMFKEHNLEVPTTWADFLACCETLKNAGITPIVMGDKDNYVMQFGLYQIAASEIYTKNPNYDNQLWTGETKFTDEGTWDKVLGMYTELYDKGYVDANSLGIGNSQSHQQFIDGKAAMIFDGGFNLGGVTNKGAVDFERGYFPLPASSGETYAAMAPGAGPAIYANSKYVKECKEILELLYDGESDLYKAAVDAKAFIPTYGYGADSVEPLFQPFMELYRNGKSNYWCNQAWPAGVNDEMQVKLSEYIGGQGTTVDDITKAMQAKFDELLAAQEK